jgi:hypothetical protein
MKAFEARFRFVTATDGPMLTATDVGIDFEEQFSFEKESKKIGVWLKGEVEEEECFLMSELSLFGKTILFGSFSLSFSRVFMSLMQS